MSEKDRQYERMYGNLELPVLYDKISFRERRIVREAYTFIQNWHCWFCEEPLDDTAAGWVKEEVLELSMSEGITFPPEFFQHPIHLHHCHISGLTQGAVHSFCNAYLWMVCGE